MEKMTRRKLFPTYYAAGIASVTPEFIRSCGCTAVLCDIDNTISHVDAPDAVQEAEVWMRQMREAGIGLAFISNNDPPRVEPFAEKYEAQYVCHAEKPKAGGYHRIAQMFNCTAENCMVVGDQLFTDILGGNRAGMYTTIVKPLCVDEDPKDFRKRRKIERFLLKLDMWFGGKKRRIGE